MLDLFLASERHANASGSICSDGVFGLGSDSSLASWRPPLSDCAGVSNNVSVDVGGVCYDTTSLNDKDSMKAIIAAGGSGTRLRPLTFSSNKHLLPVANKPLLLYPIEAIAETGIEEVGVIVNQTKPAIQSLLGNGSQWGMRITYIDQPEALGLAHVVKISEDFLDGDSFVYHLGDNIFTEGILKPFSLFSKEQPDGLVTMVKHPENHRLGVPYFDEKGHFVRYVEKPENPPNHYGCPGLYMFNSNVFGAFRGDDAIQPSARGEYEIGDLYNWLIDHHYRVIAEELEGKWMDPGKFDDMLDANAYMMDLIKDSDVRGQVDNYSTIRGRVVIGEGSEVISSTLEGPVVIGRNVRVVDAALGPHVAIQDNCEVSGVTLRESVVMEQTKIEHLSQPISHSYIGKQTRIWEEKDTDMSLFIGDHCNVKLR